LIEGESRWQQTDPRRRGRSTEYGTQSTVHSNSPHSWLRAAVQDAIFIHHACLLVGRPLGRGSILESRNSAARSPAHGTEAIVEPLLLQHQVAASIYVFTCALPLCSGGCCAVLRCAALPLLLVLLHSTYIHTYILRTPRSSSSTAYILPVY
jgi:hypothetical protein